MTRPRSELVSVADTPYYHCVCRCVRRAFLCGEDRSTGKDYSYRKGWILGRLQQLSEIFTVELCAYAVMSNHYHLVVHLNTVKAQTLSDSEVTSRWKKLFIIPVLVSRYLAGEADSEPERLAAQQVIAGWRERLCDLSWYMRCLNEYVARKANREDLCRGHFWEGRFKSQAILDEAGLLTCMAYVDLNPLRAGVVNAPEDSADVSIYERLRLFNRVKRDESVEITDGNCEQQPLLKLLPFIGFSQPDMPAGIAFELTDYLELIDWSGRVRRDDKRGYIDDDIPPILQCVGMDAKTFLNALEHHKISCGTVIGQWESRKRYARALGRSRVCGPRLSPSIRKAGA